MEVIARAFLEIVGAILAGGLIGGVFGALIGFLACALVNWLIYRSRNG